ATLQSFSDNGIILIILLACSEIKKQNKGGYLNIFHKKGIQYFSCNDQTQFVLAIVCEPFRRI
ncbi:hypothetical protein, partial [Pseudomonas syringae]|uniref:hypothetical protein n=1 Tax=Pseudomonas syringae TaxID=317 RepID=UPI0034D57467